MSGIDEAESATGPGERGSTPTEIVARARVRAPTRGNRRLEALLDGANSDPELRAWWHMAQVTSERLGMSDHSWVHVQIVLNIALRILRLLVKAGIEPAMVADHAMGRRDAEVVVAGGALLTTSAWRSIAAITRPTASSSPSASSESSSPACTTSRSERWWPLRRCTRSS